MLDVSDIMADPDVSETLTISRTATPTITNGRASTETATTISIVASVQPLTSSELQFMPEGLREQELVNVYTKTELLTRPMPDRFTYLGATYEVIDVHSWAHAAGYYQVLATRVTQT